MGTRTAWAETPTETPSDIVAAKDAEAAVEVRSAGDPVTVAEITGHVVASSGTVVVQGAAWKDICVSPCSFKLDPGLHEILVYGDGVASAVQKYDLKAGQHALLVKPGSSALETGGAYVTAAGILTTLMGAMFLVLFTETTEYHCDVDPSCPESTTQSGTRKLAFPFLIGGLAGTGLGIGMFVAGHTTLGLDPAGSSAGSKTAGLREAPLGLTYRGAL